MQQIGKLDHLCHRVLVCEEEVEAMAHLRVNPTTAIPQPQYQLQGELQKRFANLENAVHILQHEIHSDSSHQRQRSDLPEYHNLSSLPHSPPPTPSTSHQLLRSTDENGDWPEPCSNAERMQSSPSAISESSRQPNRTPGAESNEATNHDRSPQAQDSQWPIPVINLTELSSASSSSPNSLLATPSKTPRSDYRPTTPSPAHPRGPPAAPAGPSNDQRLRRRFVMQLRRALAAPPAPPAFEAAAPAPARPPMSRAELRFKGAGAAKDVAFEVRRRLVEGGCEELWAGDEGAGWDGAASVDRRTRALAVGRLGWARDVAVEGE